MQADDVFSRPNALGRLVSSRFFDSVESRTRSRSSHSHFFSFCLAAPSYIYICTGSAWIRSMSQARPGSSFVTSALAAASMCVTPSGCYIARLVSAWLYTDGVFTPAAPHLYSFSRLCNPHTYYNAEKDAERTVRALLMPFKFSPHARLIYVAFMEIEYYFQVCTLFILCRFAGRYLNRGAARGC